MGREEHRGCPKTRHDVDFRLPFSAANVLAIASGNIHPAIIGTPSLILKDDIKLMTQAFDIISTLLRVL